MPITTKEPIEATLADGNARQPKSTNYTESTSQDTQVLQTNRGYDDSPVKDYNQNTPIALNDDKVASDLNIGNLKIQKPNIDELSRKIEGGKNDAVESGTSNEKETFQTSKAFGSGYTAPEGTQYSWQTSGKEKATTQYGTDVLAAKQNAQENASTINQNLNTYQQEADMMQYQNNQEAEKVGWTGGYVLDQNRQMDYLKASLNAQMYGAIELQKYGYDTSLAAARMSYDLNQQAFAQEYYQQAVQNALNEAQITGTYFSAEVKDMMGQLTVAQQKLKENPEDENAQKIVDSIVNWFGSENLSEAGVKTLQKWEAEQANDLNWHTQTWTEYQAALESAKASIDDNPTVFLKYIDDGNQNSIISYMNDGIQTEVQTIDMSRMSNADLKEYADSCKKAREQVQAYISYLIEQAKASGITYDKDGNIVSTNQNKIDTELDKVNEKSKEILGENINVENYTPANKPNSNDTTTVESDKNITTATFNQTKTVDGIEYIGDGYVWYKVKDLQFVTANSQGAIYKVKAGTTEYKNTTRAEVVSAEYNQNSKYYVQGLGSGRINDDIDLTIGKTNRDTSTEYDLLVVKDDSINLDTENLSVKDIERAEKLFKNTEPINKDDKLYDIITLFRTLNYNATGKINEAPKNGTVVYYQNPNNASDERLYIYSDKNKWCRLGSDHSNIDDAIRAWKAQYNK